MESCPGTAQGVLDRICSYPEGFRENKKESFDQSQWEAALALVRQMDQKDRQLLNQIQVGFPVESHPYRIIGQRIGMNEQEVLARIKNLKDAGIIRRIGASIDSRRIGFVSTLLAARVPQDKFDVFVKIVNSCPGVTHNYQRDHEYNVWFTLISPSQKQKLNTIRHLSDETGVDILELPAKKIFKIKVDFRF